MTPNGSSILNGAGKECAEQRKGFPQIPFPAVKSAGGVKASALGLADGVNTRFPNDHYLAPTRVTIIQLPGGPQTKKESLVPG